MEEEEEEEVEQEVWEVEESLLVAIQHKIILVAVLVVDENI